MRRLFLEAALLWASTSAAIFTGGEPQYTGWAPLLSAFKHATVLSFCCLVSFYCNDLYDFRIVRSFRDFSARLLQSFGVAFVMLAACYAFLPVVKIPSGTFGLCLLAIVAVLLPFRALSYGLMRRRMFLERVLVLGRGPIAEKILQEIEARPHVGYEIVGVDQAIKFLQEGGLARQKPWSVGARSRMTPLRWALTALAELIVGSAVSLAVRPETAHIFDLARSARALLW
jgi:FlaA1/EpsC-like NDP-sugar epimerase